MRDLSLHLLDLVENSLRAGATAVEIHLEADPETDRLRVVIDDNGPGFAASPEQLLDPFYTTKSGKRTGLGLPLFRAAAERAGGRLTLGRAPGLGGARVEAEMRASHVDRSPLGDWAASAASLAAVNPDLDLALFLRVGPQSACVRWREQAGEPGPGRARRFGADVEKALVRIWPPTWW